jgi:cysteine synthase
LEPKADSSPYPTGKRDGKEWFEEEGASEEMKALNRKFGVLHGISASLNLTAFFSLLAYGFTLGRRFQ